MTHYLINEKQQQVVLVALKGDGGGWSYNNVQDEHIACSSAWAGAAQTEYV